MALNLPTIGKDNLIGSIIRKKRIETRIKGIIEGDSTTKGRLPSFGYDQNNNNSDDNNMDSGVLPPQLYYSDLFWNELSIAHKKKISNIINSIKKTCIILFWKKCFLDGIIGMGNISINHEKFVVPDCEKEITYFLNRVDSLIPKIFNMNGSVDLMNQGFDPDNPIHQRNGIGNKSTKQHKKSLNHASLIFGACYLLMNGYKCGNMSIIESLSCKYFPENVNDLAITKNGIEEEIAKKMIILEEIMSNLQRKSVDVHKPEPKTKKLLPQTQISQDEKSVKIVIESFKNQLLKGRKWIFQFFDESKSSILSNVVPVKHYGGDYKKRQQKGCEIITNLLKIYERDVLLLRSILNN